MKLLIHITILVFLSSPAIAQWQWALSADYNSASTGWAVQAKKPVVFTLAKP